MKSHINSTPNVTTLSAETSVEAENNTMTRTVPGLAPRPHIVANRAARQARRANH